MDNALNSVVFDYIGQTASEVNDAAGLEALSILLEKLASRPGFVTQPDRLADARTKIKNKLASIAA